MPAVLREGPYTFAFFASDRSEPRHIHIKHDRQAAKFWPSAAERGSYELWGSGYAIEWPDIDEHVSVEGLLAGRRSGECAASFERWLQSRQK